MLLLAKSMMYIACIIIRPRNNKYITTSYLTLSVFYGLIRLMSIKIRFEKGAITMQAILQDDAFPALLKLIQDHESKDALPDPPVPPQVQTTIPSVNSSEPTTDPVSATKTWLSLHSPSEVLNLFKWGTYAEKILLLGAHLEAATEMESWRSSDVEAKFDQAKEPFPSNFSRDVVVAIKEGLLSPITPRTYRVSRSGWNRISQGISKLAT
jgi:hypothetical protein